MEQTKYVLNTIPEDSSSSESIINDKTDGNLCIELTFYPDTIPQIKSYYIMTPNEYEELKSIYMDIYIENFINNENLIKDKLDIYIINNLNNIRIIKNFISNFGNPFDILSLINAKRNQPTKLSNIETITDKFSESNSDNCDELLEPIHKPKNRPDLTSQFILREKNIDSICDDIDSDSETYIDTMTEIIELYNKSKKIDNDKIKKISDNKPELLNDKILNDLINNISKDV